MFVFLFILISPLAHAGRVPSAKTASDLTRSFFNSYGKKYKSSFFGKSEVEKTEINIVREQSRHVADIEAVVYLKSGSMAHVLLTAKSDPPLGWSISSWEMLETR